MGKNFASFSAILPTAPAVPEGAQKQFQDMRTVAAANSLPTRPGPAQPIHPSLTMPSSIADATQRVEDAFRMAKVLKAVNDGKGNQALDALNGR